MVRPDPSRSIPEQVAEVEVLIRTLSRELARGRLPQAVPSVETIPKAQRSPLFDTFMAGIIRDPSLDARIRQGLQDNSPDLRRRFVAGDTRQFLKEVARAVADPLIDDALAQTRSQLDLISALAERNPEMTEESLLRDIEEGRNQLNRVISRGRLFALVVVIGSALGMAAVHLPNLIHLVRWPGLALLLTGLISYRIGRNLESSVVNRLGYGIKGARDESREISEAAALLLADVTQALALRLVEGMGNPGLIPAAVGALIFAGSFFINRLRGNALRPDRAVR